MTRARRPRVRVRIGTHRRFRLERLPGCSAADRVHAQPSRQIPSLDFQRYVGQPGDRSVRAQRHELLAVIHQSQRVSAAGTPASGPSRVCSVPSAVSGHA